MSYYSATVKRLNKQVSTVRKLMEKKSVELKVAKALATDTFENRDSLSDSEIQEYNEDLASAKANRANPWLKIYAGEYVDRLEFIEMN